MPQNGLGGQITGALFAGFVLSTVFSTAAASKIAMPGS